MRSLLKDEPNAKGVQYKHQPWIQGEYRDLTWLNNNNNNKTPQTPYVYAESYFITLCETTFIKSCLKGIQGEEKQSRKNKKLHSNRNIKE